MLFRDLSVVLMWQLPVRVAIVQQNAWVLHYGVSTHLLLQLRVQAGSFVTVPRFLAGAWTLPTAVDISSDLCPAAYC